MKIDTKIGSKVKSFAGYGIVLALIVLMIAITMEFKISAVSSLMNILCRPVQLLLWRLVKR